MRVRVCIVSEHQHIVCCTFKLATINFNGDNFGVRKTNGQPLLPIQIYVRVCVDVLVFRYTFINIILNYMHKMC